VVVITASLCAVTGCNHESDTSASASCLTDTKLVDQNGSTVELSSLKGKPMVVDFIYTSCPGPCLMETAKLANVADEKGWYFLTGGPGDVDQALAGFKLSRQIQPDGSVGHLVDMMLIGPDGRLIREYNGEIVKAQDIVDDVKKTLSKGGAA
jgi:protein SCO1/2